MNGGLDARFTVVAFHAHPDDEALMTGGLLARCSRAGHRVVLVTATDGELGLAGDDDGAGPELAARRARELDDAASALGCSRVVRLGYPDSGLQPVPDDRDCFAHRDVDEVAHVLAKVLVAERADVVTSYDENGGYGHPDHVQVHHVAARAAELAGTPVVLEATVPGALFTWVLALLARFGHQLGTSAPLGSTGLFARGDTITHRVRVGRVAASKRAALAAHASQRRGGGRRRLVDHLATLPVPLFALVLGREWYVERGRPAPSRIDDVFASLRTSVGARS